MALTTSGTPGPKCQPTGIRPPFGLLRALTGQPGKRKGRPSPRGPRVRSTNMRCSHPPFWLPTGSTTCSTRRYRNHSITTTVGPKGQERQSVSPHPTRLGDRGAGWPIRYCYPAMTQRCSTACGSTIHASSFGTVNTGCTTRGDR